VKYNLHHIIEVHFLTYLICIIFVIKELIDGQEEG